eukprot:scaffold2711_cov87-Skeletonema_dohrnii-CCMP3373.AAC.1
MLTHYERYIRNVPRMRALKSQMNTTDRVASSNGLNPLPVKERLQNYLNDAITLDGEYKTSILSSKRHANLGMIYTGDVDVSEFLDTDAHAAQIISDDGYINGGASTYDVNATAITEDENSMEDEAIELMTLAIHAAAGQDDGKMAAGRIAPHIWDAMTRHQRKAWMQLGRAMREQLLPEGTVLQPPPPPPPPRNGQNVTIPGNGVTGTRGRATNMASTHVNTDEVPPLESPATRTAYTADMSEMSIINAMQANSLTGPTPSGGLHSSRREMQVKNPLDPTRLLSTSNVSTRQLVPLPKNTAANLAMNGNDRRVTMAIASPSPPIGNRSVSTAMHSAPVFITRSNVSRVLSSARFPNISTSTDEDTNPWSVNMTVMNPHPSVWSLSDSDLDVILGLIDGGANVGLANPNYLRLLQYALPSRKINVSGIGNSRLDELRIGTFAGTAMTSCGHLVLLIFNEYGEMEIGEGSDGGQIVHSKMQLEDGGCLVNDRPLQLMGEQNIIPTTVEGYTIPITYVNGLPHVKTTYPTDAQLDTLPRIVMTKETPWNPRRYDGDRAAGSTFTDAYYLDEEVIGEAGERVIEIEDEDNEDLIQELDEDDEDSQDELPPLVGIVDSGANGSIAIPFRDLYGLSDSRTKIPRVPRSFQEAMTIACVHLYDNIDIFAGRKRLCSGLPDANAG